MGALFIGDEAKMSFISNDQDHLTVTKLMV